MVMNYQITEATKDDAQQWDAIVVSSTHGTIFHTWNWLNIVKKYTDSEFHPLIFKKGNEPLGIIPVFYQERSSLRMVFSPPPYLALLFLGPVLTLNREQKAYKNEVLWIDMQRELEAYLQSHFQPQYCQISTAPGLNDARPYKWAGFRTENSYDYLIDIKGGPDALWENLPKNFRQDINRSVKNNITVEQGGEKELGIIYDLLVQRYREQGRPVKVPKEYLLDLYRAFHENIRIFVAKYDGNIVTGSVELAYRDIIGSWIGNLKPSVNISPSPNGILIWEMMRYAASQGFHCYTVYGAAGNERLYQYYLTKFNPLLQYRFTAKKVSAFGGIVEKGYLCLVKPLKEKMTVYRN
jgi:hypothetical protein